MNKKYISNYEPFMIVINLLVAAVFGFFMGLAAELIFGGYFALAFVVGFCVVALLMSGGWEVLCLDSEKIVSYSVFGKRYECKYSAIEVAEYATGMFGTDRSGPYEVKLLILYTKERHNIPKFARGTLINKRKGNRALAFYANGEESKAVKEYLSLYRPDLEIKEN